MCRRRTADRLSWPGRSRSTSHHRGAWAAQPWNRGVVAPLVELFEDAACGRRRVEGHRLGMPVVAADVEDRPDSRERVTRRSRQRSWPAVGTGALRPRPAGRGGRPTAVIGVPRDASDAASDARRSLATDPSTDSTAGSGTSSTSRRPPSSRRTTRSGMVVAVATSIATRPRAWAAPSSAARNAGTEPVPRSIE